MALSLLPLVMAFLAADLVKLALVAVSLILGLSIVAYARVESIHVPSSTCSTSGKEAERSQASIVAKACLRGAGP